MPIIEVKDLSKKYYLGATVSHDTLRDVIAHGFKSLFTRKSLQATSQNNDPDFIWALKDVSFEVNEGDVIGIIGRNGAGKSTLLKILSRITEPTEGEIRLKGRVASLLEVGTGFHPELTGRENIFLNGTILGMTKNEIKRKFDEIVAFAEIEKFIDTPVKRYSSGMYVRLAFAVAAHLEPEILIIDEVLAVGDIQFQKKCLGKMGDVSREGRTVLFVSHNMDPIRSLCKNAIWLDNGQIAAQGLASDVVHNYEKTESKSLEKFSGVMERNPDEIKGKSFYFSKVEMKNVDGENTTTFKYNDKMVLIVELNGNPMPNMYSPEFRIFGETGQLVAVGASGEYHNIYFGNKNKGIKIEIGPLILTSGKFRLSLSVITGKTRSDTWENACFFNIIESRPFRSTHNILSSAEGVCILQQSFHEVEQG